MINFHVDPVKQLLGQLTAFPVTFFFFFIQRLTEPILANFGLKLFQPKRRKADTCSSYKHGHFIMAPWGSTVLTKFHRNQQQQIVGRNKQERKESSSTQSKARSKTSAVKPNNMTLFIIHSLSFLNMEEIPILCKSNWTYLSVHSLRKHQSKESPFHGFLDYVRIKQKQKKRKKKQKNKEINQKPTSRLQLSCAIWMNVQNMHAALSARRAWPSFSCRCVSTGEACQTPGSPFQRCQRTFQVLSGAPVWFCPHPWAV